MDLKCEKAILKAAIEVFYKDNHSKGKNHTWNQFKDKKIKSKPAYTVRGCISETDQDITVSPIFSQTYSFLSWIDQASHNSEHHI